MRFLTYNQVRDLLKRLRDQSKVKLLIGPPTDVPGAPTEPASAPPEAAAPTSSAAPSTPLKPGRPAK